MKYDLLRKNGSPEANDIRAMLRSHEVRVDTCRQIAEARGWPAWARGHIAEPEAHEVAGAIVWMSQGMFILSREPNLEVRPTQTDLRNLLVDTGALDWLIREGANLPSWLTSDD